MQSKQPNYTSAAVFVRWPTVLVGIAMIAVCHLANSRESLAQDQAADAPLTDSELPIRPCGTYDIGALEEHFRVIVESREVAPGRYEVTISTVKAEDGDSRKPLPAELMQLMLLDGKGGTQLETPIPWTKGNSRFGATDGFTTTLILTAAIAPRLVLMTRPGETLFSEPGHVVIVGFRSLASD